MIDKVGNKYELACDICGESVDEIFYDFQDAVNYKKVNSWKSKKKFGEWFDICPDCLESEADAK